MDVDLETPDHTTLSRRGRQLDVPLCRLGIAEPIHLIVDSSGLAIFGEGEWAAVKHGSRGIQGWRKLHLGVDDAGVIVAQLLTNSNLDDATAGIDLTGQVDGTITTVVADAAYDTRPFYNAGSDRGAAVVVPPNKRATVTRRRCPARDETVRRVDKVGRRRWKKESGYYRQARVENVFFRYKSIISDRFRARGQRAQAVEARLACNALNRMTAIGRPASIAIGS